MKFSHGLQVEMSKKPWPRSPYPLLMSINGFSPYRDQFGTFLEKEK